MLDIVHSELKTLRAQSGGVWVLGNDAANQLDISLKAPLKGVF